MNKKLFIGFASAVAVGSFWACGDGTINEMNYGDEVAYGMYARGDSTSAQQLKADAMTACRLDPECEAQYHDYLLDPEGYKSSQAQTESSSDEAPGISSSSTLLIPSSSSIVIGGRSSSSVNIIDPDPTSSAGGTTPVSGLGSCAPASNTIEKGASVKWTFKPNGEAVGYTVMDFAKATYTWNFGADATDDGSGTGTNSGNVTYASSGVHSTSVVVTMNDLKSETVTCSPLQVNGDPITGCLCTTTATGSVNYLETPSVSWSVSGCTSAANISSYSWDGTAGETSFSKTFTAATASYAPVLKVGNDDNTVIEVTCPAVKITEGAEYTIKEAQNAGAIALPAGSSTVVLEASGYNNTVFCNANGALSGSVNGSPLSGSYYVAVQLAAGSLEVGKTLDFVLDAPATCGIQ